MQRVQIHIAGRLDEDWSKWLEGFRLSHTEPDETVLTGEVKDQAALYGLIAKLRDLGVVLTGVRIEAAEDGGAEEGIGTSQGITSND